MKLHVPFSSTLTLRSIIFLGPFGMSDMADIGLYIRMKFAEARKVSVLEKGTCSFIHAEWTQEDDATWVFTIRADRFLRNMVRAIVGTLIEVGRGKLTIEGFRRVIEQQDRCKAGTSAPGQALFLVNVEYPESIFE